MITGWQKSRKMKNQTSSAWTASKALARKLDIDIARKQAPGLKRRQKKSLLPKRPLILE